MDSKKSKLHQSRKGTFFLGHPVHSTVIENSNFKSRSSEIEIEVLESKLKKLDIEIQEKDVQIECLQQEIFSLKSSRRKPSIPSFIFKHILYIYEQRRISSSNKWTK